MNIIEVLTRCIFIVKFSDLQLLNKTKSGQHMQSTTGWYQGFWVRKTPGDQVLLNMEVNATYAQVIFVWHIFHVTVQGLIKYNNDLLNPALHEVWCVFHKMAMYKNVLCHNIFSQCFSSHHHFVEHDTHAHPTSFNLTILYTYLDQ